MVFLSWEGLWWHRGIKKENTSGGPTRVPDLTALCPEPGSLPQSPHGNWHCQKQQNWRLSQGWGAGGAGGVDTERPRHVFWFTSLTSGRGGWRETSLVARAFCRSVALRRLQLAGSTVNPDRQKVGLWEAGALLIDAYQRWEDAPCDKKKKRYILYIDQCNNVITMLILTFPWLQSH